MKLTALKASSVRGIPKDWSPLPIGDKGLIVYGPNGVGKSSIIDAIEFALTGQSTLFAKDAQGYSWVNASPHVQHGQPTIALSLNDGGTVRDIKAGNAIPPWFSQQARDWIDIAKKSKFVLRRHMLLRFISEQPKPRYDLLEPFFNMESFTKIEDALQKQETEDTNRKSEIDAKIKTLETQLRSLFAAQPNANLSEAALYALLNSTLDKLGLTRCVDSALLTARKAEIVRQLGGKEKTERIGTLQSLKTSAQKLGSPSALAPLLDNFLSALVAYEKEVSHRTQEVMTDFLMRGHDIIAATNLEACPLCEETIKDRGVLLQRLNERIAADKRITSAKEQIVSAKNPFVLALRELQGALNGFITQWKATVGNTLVVAYPAALDLLTKLLDNVDDEAVTYEQLAHYPALVGVVVLDHAAVLKIIEDLMISEGAGEKYTLLSKADSMIDALLKEWEQHKRFSASSKVIYRHITILKRLHAYAVESRKETIQTIVDCVSAIANKFYDMIHPNEAISTSKLAVRQAASASVEIKASFYGEESHPMRYFSESHLDTLGLCYFLALCKHHTDTTPSFRLLILDDVMHSVDAQHRNRIAEILSDHFSDFQIIITTHDKPFYDKLHQKLGSSCYAYKTISDWNIEQGPILGDQTTNLENITNVALRNIMSRENLAGAGGICFEWLLKELTEGLNIAIPARFKGKHTLGTLWPPTSKKMKDHKGFSAVHPTLASELDANIWVRSECGCHDNDTASAADLKEVQEFARLLADLYAATWCGGCRRFITKQADGGWRCVCAKLNYPMKII
ncbi:MAG: AAA family ATPase [Nitrospirae bacterium]|nr:AAA family ATPase [Nitrospirota bacterium]